MNKELVIVEQSFDAPSDQVWKALTEQPNEKMVF